MAAHKKADRCIGRSDGDFHGSYPCAKKKQPGSEYCFWHDTRALTQRLETMRQRRIDRQLEKESRGQ